MRASSWSANSRVTWKIARDGRLSARPAPCSIGRWRRRSRSPTLYLTNAVKHFSWEPRGKRRIHKKPRVSEMKACKPWLEAELTRIKPAVIVGLGATAVQALLGPGVTIAGAKGKVFDTPFGAVIVTRHPSSVLRLREQSERRAALKELVDDLKAAARFAAKRK